MDQSILFRMKLICLLRWNFTRFHFIYQNFLGSYFWSWSDFRLIKIICRRGLPSLKCRYIIFVVNKHSWWHYINLWLLNSTFSLNSTSIMTQVYLWSFLKKFLSTSWTSAAFVMCLWIKIRKITSEIYLLTCNCLKRNLGKPQDCESKMVISLLIICLNIREEVHVHCEENRIISPFSHQFYIGMD